MLLLDEFDFLKGNSTFAVDPLAIDEVVVPHINDLADASDIAVRDEAKAARFLRPLLFHNHAVFQVTKLEEIRTELF